jgi:prephenate dehydratase
VILAPNVADHGHNTTRFVVLGTDTAIPEQGSGPTITTFVFRIRNVPAALYNAIGGFATNGVNMTKLESYQLGGSFSATQFYADVEGHPEEPSLARALHELDHFCEEFRLLGTYPASPFRNVAPATPNGRSSS